MRQDSKPKGRIAWGVTPMFCGVTTVYRVVGEGLRRAGWDVRAVTAGMDAAQMVDEQFSDEHLDVLLPGSSDARAAAAELVRWVGAQKIDAIFCTGQIVTLAAAPALPPHVKLITRVANMTNRAYELATQNLDRIDAIVVETPRQHQDMVRDWKVDPRRCVVIPGGIGVDAYSPGAVRDFSGSLRLIYLGRLDEDQKAVMLLPQIAGQLITAGLDFHLDIIGDGPDGARLRQAFAHPDLKPRVTFHGTMRREEALPHLQRAHLFLLPTRYEGVSWALLETMASGCVPVASLLTGTTDYVVNHGVSGVLCTVGKASDFAKAVLDLAADRNRLEQFSDAAVRTVHKRFTLQRVVNDHERLLQSLLAQERRDYTPIPIEAIEVPNLAGPAWRRYVPRGVKNYVRTLAERLHRTV